MKQLFISDLHLQEQDPQVASLFYQFMQTQAVEADELYVLGDLFEAWIGDDGIDNFAANIISIFKNYSDAGGKLYFIHGNRDFLLGDAFAKATSGQILDEPYRLNVAGQNAILMHGDSLCTQDQQYMQFRQQVRDPEWQQQFLSQTVDVRRSIARDIREQSMARGQMIEEEISDVTPSEVLQLMETTEVRLLIHGHTHRQARHKLLINGQHCERIVLGDWGKTGSVLIAENDLLKLENFSLSD